MPIDPNAGTGTHDAILRDKTDPVHAGPLGDWRDAEDSIRARSGEPASFRPGRPDWMMGWRSCQEQVVAYLRAESNMLAGCGSGPKWTATEAAERALRVCADAIAAMRPEAPR